MIGLDKRRDILRFEALKRFWRTFENEEEIELPQNVLITRLCTCRIAIKIHFETPEKKPLLSESPHEYLRRNEILLGEEKK